MFSAARSIILAMNPYHKMLVARLLQLTEYTAAVTAAVIQHRPQGQHNSKQLHLQWGGELLIPGDIIQ